MELDFTTQLQPALWGLLLALVTSATALVAAADHDEIDMLRHYRVLRDKWRRRVRRARAFGDRLVARITTLFGLVTGQLSSRARR